MKIFTRAHLDRVARRQNTCRFILQTILGLEVSPRPLILRARIQWSSTISPRVTFPTNPRT